MPKSKSPLDKDESGESNESISRLEIVKKMRRDTSPSSNEMRKLHLTLWFHLFAWFPVCAAKASLMSPITAERLFTETDSLSPRTPWHLLGCYYSSCPQRMTFSLLSSSRIYAQQRCYLFSQEVKVTGAGGDLESSEEEQADCQVAKSSWDIMHQSHPPILGMFSNVFELLWTLWQRRQPP
ncbi:hypothetical protein HETIRDRAFT_426198 [Heterobasidion irregulare TC 32-1]|uniref:Uncharacterized protein n=1 Tax=Heterobasidion irregulare (strain TC 32-1) TaxID=747525 RepID=W4K9Q0_HETIT|nr:uncharacterized protein HETIRDRAFT_426198 [Heterobasidion irregulare TC 32-1]ETW82572.1 hypothetical protein HETIRDRAFT_426198 [Heterobasidion irregulare TC 32-1]